MSQNSPGGATADQAVEPLSRRVTSNNSRRLALFELRVETAPKALALLEAGWPTRAVSLVGDDLRFELPSFGEHHFVVRFHDVESDSAPGFVPPTVGQLQAVLEHCRGLEEADRLLVHCHAGKSRSPAMAIGILIDNGVPPEEAFGRVKAHRPTLIPNRLMIRHLDRLLALEGELIEIVSRHYRSLPPEALLPDRGGLNL